MVNAHNPSDTFWGNRETLTLRNRIWQTRCRSEARSADVHYNYGAALWFSG